MQGVCSQDLYSFKPSSSDILCFPAHQYGDIDDTEKLSTKIVSEIKEQFIACGFDTSNLTTNFTKPFLPREYDNKHEHHIKFDIFRRFHSNPLTVSDLELAQIFRIYQCHSVEDRWERSVCYYQSWLTTKKELQIIIERMKQSYTGYKQLGAWSLRIENLNEDQQLYIRYVGQTRQPPYERGTFIPSWNQKQRASIYSDFKEIFEKLHPEIRNLPRIFALSDSCATKLLPDGTKDVERTDEELLTDTLERFLIALFGYPLLLNTQGGGSYATFSPCCEDIEMFGKLNMSGMENLFRSSSAVSHTPDDIVKRLSANADLICNIITKMTLPPQREKDNLQHVKTNYVKQAISRLFHERCVCAIIGQTVSQDALKSNSGFFHGGSVSSKVVLSYLKSCAELELKVIEKEYFDRLLSMFSFTNVFNWVETHGRRDHQTAETLLHNYLGAISPILTVTMGERALSSCIHQNRRNLISKLGTAWIQKVGRLAQATYTILLPQQHPGRGSRSDQSQETRRLEFLCWIQVWVYLRTVLLVLSTGNSLTVAAGSKVLCEEVHRIANAQLETVGFQKSLEAVKAAHMRNESWRSEARKRPAAERPRIRDKRPLLTEAEPASACSGEHPESVQQTTNPDPFSTKTLRSYQFPAKVVTLDEVAYRSQIKRLSEQSVFLDRLVTLGQLRGEPQSQERQTWIVNNRPKFDHEIKNAHGLSCQAWKLFVSDLPEGSYLANCIDALKEVTSFSETIQDLFNETANQKNIDLDCLTFVVKHEILDDVAKDLLEGKDRFLKQRTTRRGVFDIRRLNGLNFGTKDGQPILLCRGLDGSVVRVKVERKRSIMRVSSQFGRRVFEFVPSGIRVVDEHGKAITVAAKDLKTWGQNLDWLWKEGVTIPESGQGQNPFYVHQGKETIL